MAGLKRIADRHKFQAKVNRAVSKLGIDDPLWVEDGKDKPDAEFEDDGSLHIRRAGLRAVFGVSNGQNASNAEQNKQTRAIMDALSMKRRTEYVLVGETEDDDCDQCPIHCPHLN